MYDEKTIAKAEEIYNCAIASGKQITDKARYIDGICKNLTVQDSSAAKPQPATTKAQYCSEKTFDIRQAVYENDMRLYGAYTYED